MPKVKLKQATLDVSAETKERNNCKKGKEKAGKKRKYFYKHMEPKPKEAKKNTFLPPMDVTEFSANWKNLLMVSSFDITRCLCVSVCLIMTRGFNCSVCA